MGFFDQIAWGLEDFLAVGALLVALGSTITLAWRASTSGLYRAGVMLAALGGFTLIYINLAVGIIGDEQNPRNLVFFVIPAFGYVGALIGRFRALVMVRLLIGMAAVQFSTVLLAPADILHIMIPFTGLFVGLWLLSALMIRRSIRP